MEGKFLKNSRTSSQPPWFSSVIAHMFYASTYYDGMHSNVEGNILKIATNFLIVFFCSFFPIKAIDVVFVLRAHGGGNAIEYVFKQTKKKRNPNWIKILFQNTHCDCNSHPKNETCYIYEMLEIHTAPKISNINKLSAQPNWWSFESTIIVSNEKVLKLRLNLV